MINGKKALSEINLDKYSHELIYRSLVLTPEEYFGLGLMFKTDNKKEYDNQVHPRYVLVIVLRGRGTLYDENGEKYDLHAGMCFKRIPGKAETLSIESEGGWVEFFIEIGPALYQALRSMRIVENKPLCEDIDIDEDFFFELMDCKEKFKTIDERALTSIVGDFVKLLTSCQQRCSKNPREENLLVDAACAFLSSNFNEECDLKKFCRKQGIGYENLRKIFKKQIGISPWQYRIRRRLDLACALLRDPKVSISEIARELGYATAYDFSAQFKKYFKTSPTFYRDGRTQ